MSVSFILTLKTTDDGFYAKNMQRANLLLTSLVKFCTFPVTLVVCVPEAELSAAKAAITSQGNITVSFIGDEDALPGITTSPARPWFKAQILKMALVANATTDYVLALDPDIVAVRSFAQTDLVSVDGIYNNRLIDKQARLVIYNNAIGILDKGLAGISPYPTKPVDYPYKSQIDYKLKTMHTSPAMYSVSVMKSLIQALSAQSVGLVPLAEARGFTIETLYTTFAQLNNAFNTADSDLLGTHYNSGGLTDNSNMWFDPESGIFSFISSRLRVSAWKAKSLWQAAVGND